MQRFDISRLDWMLLLPLSILIIFGLVTLFSVDQAYFKSQAIFLIFSVLIFLFISQINLSVLRFYSVPIYFVSLILLFAVLILGIETRGSIRWLEFFGFRIQFSEILKPFLAVSFSSYLASVKNYSFMSFIKCMALLGPVVLLIFLQPDLGNALIYLIVAILVLLVYGFPFKWFFGGFLFWLSSVPFFWLILRDYQKQRLLTFLDPSRDPLGTSYNAIQAVIAVGSGMLTGKGLGQGTQAQLRFLPERHTDFIFATLSEQLGFIGGAIVILCFAFVLYRLWLIVRSSEERFSRLFCLTAFLILFVHFFVNIGMNIGLVPIVGVTLPFLSYGGSSLLSNFILLGLVFAVAKNRRPTFLEIG